MSDDDRAWAQIVECFLARQDALAEQRADRGGIPVGVLRARQGQEVADLAVEPLEVCGNSHAALVSDLQMPWAVRKQSDQDEDGRSSQQKQCTMSCSRSYTAGEQW